MKKSVFSMMLIGMMMLGTVNTFGKTTTNGHHDKFNEPRTECHLRHIHDGHCNGTPCVDRNKVYPGMDEGMRHHIIEGRHVFGCHNECKICHLTKREIRNIENEMHHNVGPRPMPKTSHFGR